MPTSRLAIVLFVHLSSQPIPVQNLSFGLYSSFEYLINGKLPMVEITVYFWLIGIFTQRVSVALRKSTEIPYPSNMESILSIYLCNISID